MVKLKELDGFEIFRTLYSSYRPPLTRDLDQMSCDMALMGRANPVLVSGDRCDEYPLEYRELKHYLASNGVENLPMRRSRAYTQVDFTDHLLYKAGGSVDLDRKLACEYALYQVQSRKSEQANGSMASLMALRPWSLEWYECVVGLLESINASDLDVPQLGGASGGGAALKRSRTLVKTRSDLQELTSFVLSDAIKKGIELEPVNMDDSLEFLKTAFETMAVSSRGKQDPVQKDQLETAFKDLQLAHSFLTKQFENDRNEYLENIEKLQRTNKELQQRLLDYHSDLSQAETKLQETERELSTSRERQRSIQMTSPIFARESWADASPGSAKSANSNAHSIPIMRTEFKRLLTESQRKYERELQEEREARAELQRELESLKNN